MEEIERFMTPKTAEELQLDKEYRHGKPAPFIPQLTLESLTGYGPAIAADGTRAKEESVLQGLRALSGGAQFVPEEGQWGIPRHTANRLKYQEGVYFFSDVREREHLMSDPKAVAKLPEGKIPGPEENVKKAVLDAVVRGAYEKPDQGQHGYFLRNESWTSSGAEVFESRVSAMVAKGAAGRNGGKQKGKQA